MFYMPIESQKLLVFCFCGACVSVLPSDLRVLLDVLCRPIKYSKIKIIIHCFGFVYQVSVSTNILVILYSHHMALWLHILNALK